MADEAKKAAQAAKELSDARSLEAMERMNASQPTPTQEENDLAKLGALPLDEKEDDGSGPDLHPYDVADRAMAGESEEVRSERQEYQNRALESRRAGSKRARGGRKGRKSE